MLLEKRMDNPATLLPDANKGFQSLFMAMSKSGVPQSTLELVHLRTSQINGCSVCVVSGIKSAKREGETDERLFAVAAWRDAPYFTDAERAALALAEAVTRIADRADPVPDAIWEEATRCYNEQELAGILLMIATTNLFNRLNLPTRQVAGSQSW